MIDSIEKARKAERFLTKGIWTITVSAIILSALVVTPLAAGTMPKGWSFVGALVPLVGDTALVIVVKMEGALGDIGAESKGWPKFLRFLTSVFSVLLNIGQAALKADWVGMGVHLVAPTLLIAASEAGISYRRTIQARVEELEKQAAIMRADADKAAAANRKAAKAEQRAEEDQERERAEEDAMRAHARAMRALELQSAGAAEAARIAASATVEAARLAAGGEQAKAAAEVEKARLAKAAAEKAAAEEAAERARVAQESARMAAHEAQVRLGEAMAKDAEQAHRRRQAEDEAERAAHDFESRLHNFASGGLEWSQEEILVAIRRLQADGLSQARVAERMGRSQTWVSRQINAAQPGPLQLVKEA